MATVVASRSQPGRAGWLTRIAIVVGGVGLIAGVAFGAASLYRAWRAPDSFDRSAIDGSLTVRLDAGQHVVVYDESGSTHALGDLALSVTSATGAAVPVEPYHGLLQYDHGNVVARAIANVTAVDGGMYQIHAAGAAAGALAVGVDLVDLGIDGLVRGALIAALALIGALALGAMGRMGRVSGSDLP
jgi:hypothetical protein